MRLNRRERNAIHEHTRRRYPKRFLVILFFFKNVSPTNLYTITSLFLFLADGLQERRVRRPATVLDRALRHVHRVVATLVRVRGAHPTVDGLACVKTPR